MSTKMNASAKPFHAKMLSQDAQVAKAVYAKTMIEQLENTMDTLQSVDPKIKEFADAFAFRPAWAYTDDDNLDDIVAAYWASIGKK